MNYKKVTGALIPGVIGVVFVTVFVGIIGGALHNPTPHKLPIAVVAPTPIAQQLQKGANAKFPDAIDIKQYTSASDAQQDLRNERVYGVISPAKDGLRTTVSSASGEASKGIVTALGTAAAANMHMKSSVTDITPQASGMGHVLVTMFLFLAVTIAAVLGQTLLLQQKELKFAAWLGTSVLSAVLVGIGATTTAVLLGEFSGAFWNVVAALSVSYFAGASVLAGMQNMFGKKGFGVASLLLVPLGVATSGAIANKYFLPDFYSTIAPYMLSSATITAVRHGAYLQNAAIGSAYSVLAVWSLVGMALRFPKRHHNA